jgi:acyl carrier protein
MELEKKIKDIMADLLDVDTSLIGSYASMDNLGGWNSLKSLHLVLALEEEFEIEFTEEEITLMNNLPSILEISTNKIKL